MDGSAVSLGEIERHFWLTRSMARLVGVNLSEAMSSGRLSPSEYTEMVTHCRVGGCHEICQQWLACQTGAVDEIPSYCAHRDVLTRLR